MLLPRFVILLKLINAELMCLMTTIYLKKFARIIIILLVLSLLICMINAQTTILVIELVLKILIELVPKPVTFLLVLTVMWPIIPKHVLMMLFILNVNVTLVKVILIQKKRLTLKDMFPTEVA